MKQIIILETNPASGGLIAINAVFWFPVTSGREIPIASATSFYKQASASEITALQNGTVIEEFRPAISFPNSFTTAQIQGSLAATWTARKAYLDTLPNPIAVYGKFWDGTTWT